MSQHLVIRLGLDGNFELNFQIRDTPVAELWVERMQARGSYPLDHPDRFYGFGTLAQEQLRAVEYIQKCIATINSHEYLIIKSSEYINFEPNNEEIEALQAEIAQLRMDLLDEQKKVIELQIKTNI